MYFNSKISLRSNKNLCKEPFRIIWTQPVSNLGVAPITSVLCCLLFFFKIFCRTQVLFVGPLIPLFWTSGDICPGFQSQGGFPCLCASSPVYNRFLRFTSGATPAFSTNSGVHCISVYTAWLARLLSHVLGFEPPMQW